MRRGVHTNNFDSTLQRSIKGAAMVTFGAGLGLVSAAAYETSYAVGFVLLVTLAALTGLGGVRTD